VNAVVVPTAQFALKMHRPASLSYDAGHSYDSQHSTVATHFSGLAQSSTQWQVSSEAHAGGTVAAVVGGRVVTVVSTGIPVVVVALSSETHVTQH